MNQYCKIHILFASFSFYLISFLHFRVSSRMTHYFFFLLSRATPVAHGSSQARGRIWAAAASPHHCHSNTRCLTHRLRQGMEPTSSCILVSFVPLSHNGNSQNDTSHLVVKFLWFFLAVAVCHTFLDFDSFKEYWLVILQNASLLELVWCFFQGWTEVWDLGGRPQK